MEPNSPATKAQPEPPETRAHPRAANLSDPERWVEEHGDHLFKFAYVRLRDQGLAEDMVQDTFLAALKGAKAFEGRSAEKSWLIGILNHKILDHFRKASRETSFTNLEFYQDEESERFIPDGLFKGGWIHEPNRNLAPMEWPNDPGSSLDSAAFWKSFHDCANKLPRNIAAVFALREIDGLDSKEICQSLKISESNLWVMMHRARMALRTCLEKNWFGKGN